MDLISLFHAMGGILTFGTLIRNGFTRYEIRTAVRAGTIHHVRRGVYATRDAAPDVLAAARHGGMLTCISALRVMNVWVLPSDPRAHVWLGANGQRREHAECSCVNHWSPGKTGVGRVDVETALVHLRQCAGDLAFFASLESAWAKRLLSTAARSRIRDRLPASRRSLVDRAVGTAGSGLESILRFILMQVGLELETQVAVDTVGRVDFITRVNGRILIIEVDGREFHTSRTAFNQDRHRQAAASIMGIETLNFSYDQVLNHPQQVLASIRAALVRARDAA